MLLKPISVQGLRKYYTVITNTLSSKFSTYYCPTHVFILCFQIFHGKIRARFDYGSGEGVGVIDQVRVNDGKWHDLEMKRKERNVRLTLDSGEYMKDTVASGSMSFLNVHLNNIIIGAELSRRSIKSVSCEYDTLTYSNCK